MAKNELNESPTASPVNRSQAIDADKLPDVGNLQIGTAAANDTVPESASAIIKSVSSSAKVQERPSVGEAQDCIQQTNEFSTGDEEYDSAAEGSDVFDEDAFDYDSDGDIIFALPTKTDNEKETPAYVVDPEVIDERTPLQRFLASFSDEPANCIEENENCGICGGKLKVLGKIAESSLRLHCGHKFGRECLEVVLKPVTEGGWGSRKCPICRAAIVVPGE